MFLLVVFSKYLSERKSEEDVPTIQTGNYVFKVNNRNTRTRCEIFLFAIENYRKHCPKLQ